ncbi:hypothetical protein COLO4_27549 [Corchorus olitorius]|uniref:Uncharacterized protein n=1 Tax=Corchorus olitorius TaxID=93759 RepID=A0A1R3HQC5_9ROSI|nr:hypothetical protein COLO4_27549 [Corchorus olitorius]
MAIWVENVDVVKDLFGKTRKQTTKESTHVKHKKSKPRATRGRI